MAKISLEMFSKKYEYPVHWAEMDAARHVNNIIYLRWAETARIDYFGEMGMDTGFNGEVGPILGWQECKYIFPITYPDTAIVGIKATDIEEDRFMLECGIFSKKNERIAAFSKHLIIPYDYISLKKTHLPESWVKGLEAMEA